VARAASRGRVGGRGKNCVSPLAARALLGALVGQGGGIAKHKQQGQGGGGARGGARAAGGMHREALVAIVGPMGGLPQAAGTGVPQ